MQPSEQSVRSYALHLAMQVRRRGRELWLYERYGGRQKFGPLRSWRAVEQAISKYGAAELRRMKRTKSKWMEAENV